MKHLIDLFLFYMRKLYSLLLCLGLSILLPFLLKCITFAPLKLTPLIDDVNFGEISKTTLLMLHTPIWISSPTLSPPDTRPSTRCTTPLEIPPPQKLRSNTLTQSQRLHHIPNKPVVDENRHERSFVTSFCNVNNDTSDPLATPIQSRSNREHTRLSYKAWTREQGLLVCCYSYSKTLVWEEGELKG